MHSIPFRFLFTEHSYKFLLSFPDHSRIIIITFSDISFCLIKIKCIHASRAIHKCLQACACETITCMRVCTHASCMNRSMLQNHKFNSFVFDAADSELVADDVNQLAIASKTRSRLRRLSFIRPTFSRSLFCKLIHPAHPHKLLQAVAPFMLFVYGQNLQVDCPLRSW